MQTEALVASVDSGLDLGVHCGYGLLDYWLSLLPSLFISVSVCSDQIAPSLPLFHTSALFFVMLSSCPLGLVRSPVRFLYPLSFSLARYIHVDIPLSLPSRLPSFFSVSFRTYRTPLILSLFAPAAQQKLANSSGPIGKNRIYRDCPDNFQQTGGRPQRLPVRLSRAWTTAGSPPTTPD